MTFSVEIDAAAWRSHCDAVRDEFHGVHAALIPVVKGNGYGLGQVALAQEVTRLGLPALAVGTVFEAAEVAAAFAGDILVLEPIDPRDHVAAAAWTTLDGSAAGGRCIRTVATPEGLDLVLDTHEHRRVILEARTSMRRFGLEGPALASTWSFAAAAQQEGRLRVHGVSAHLPLAPRNADFDEILQIVDEIEAVATEPVHLLLSHVTIADLEILRRHNPRLHFSVRIGTRLWLGRREALRAFGTVLAVQPVKQGDPVGYHQRAARTAGQVLVVSGGTAHGIGLAAPQPVSTLRQRAIAFATGALAAIGFTRSPFTFDGCKLRFVEPPHQHVSLLWLPASTTAPAIGAQLAANVRYTTTRADLVSWR